MKKLLIITFLLPLFPYLLLAQEWKLQEKSITLMGSRFGFSTVAENDSLGWKAINRGIKEVERIEQLISSWNPASQTSEINRNAGIKPVKVDKELFDLIFRAKKVSELSGGAFDISFASMDKIWKFDGSMTEMPSPETVREAASKINWENITLNKTDQTVFLKESGMKISFGATGKGYAANKARQVMEKAPGVKGGIVNAGGDLVAWGKSLEPEGWTIKIANPKNKNTSLGWLKIEDLAVITSGDYERFVEFDGKRYAHIIDPRTGYPTTGIQSVTIICPDAELADALATTVFVLGLEEGMALINQLKGIECMIVDDQKELHTSANLEIK